MSTSLPLFHNRALYEPLLLELNERIEAVTERGQFILGPEVEAFEQEFAAYLGVSHVIGVANGTDALAIALRAAGVGPGDEVVVPAFTFYATAEAVANIGAIPVFCDVDADTFCMRAADVEGLISVRTRALLPVHLFGNAAAIGELKALVADKQIAVIEDAAQAAGAELDSVKVGALGDAACFSFFPSKNLFCFGDGGAIATNSNELAELVRMLRFHGSREKKVHHLVGYNSRLDELQATVLRRLLPELDDWNQGRQRVAAAYAAAGLGEHVELPLVSARGSHVYHLYVARSERRDQLAAGLAEAGIEARPYYAVPLHKQPALRAFTSASQLPVCERLAATNLALPIGPNLSDDQVEQVVSTVAHLG